MLGRNPQPALKVTQTINRRPEHAFPVCQHHRHARRVHIVHVLLDDAVQSFECFSVLCLGRTLTVALDNEEPSNTGNNCRLRCK